MKGRDDLLGCDLYCIRSLNTRDFYTCVREYHFKKKAERNTWLAERASPARQGRKDHFIPAPVAATVCKHCFIAYYGISQATYSRVAKRRINEGQQCFDLTRPKKRWLKEIARDGVVPWLEDYAQRTGEWMPDKLNHIHLPDYKWSHVWARYVQEHETLKKPYVQYPHFLSIAQSDASFVKIRKYSRFAQCRDCSELKEKIKKTTGVVRQSWQTKLTAHNDWQMRERAKYKKDCLKSKPGSDSICISVDSMDQDKTSVPSQARVDKDTDGQTRLHTHITGVVVHGRDPGAYCYTWLDRYPHGSDVVTTVLLDVLNRIPDLPRTLNLYLDNCWRENKNRFASDVYISLL